MIKVSMIIPVYNAENFLKTMLETVVNQTLREIEIILINDGSKDRSGEICDDYAKKDARIRVVHQENAGMCAARNLAMDMAVGEYIAFADNDDVMELNLLEKAYGAAKEYDADVVKFGRKSDFLDEKGKVIKTESRTFRKRVYKGNALEKEYFDYGDMGCLRTVWDGIYKTKVIRENNLRFHNEFRYGCEDMIFCRELVPYIHCMVLIEGCFYTHYMRNWYSASSKFNRNALKKFKDCYALEKKVWEKLGIDNRQSGKKELEIIKEYILGLTVMLSEKNCSWSMKQKVDYLRNESNFNLNLSVEKVKNMWKLNKKQTIAGLLYHMKMYRLLLIFTQLYMIKIEKNMKANIKG